MQPHSIKCIGISGINATDNPGPGVPIAQSLKMLHPSLKLLGLSYDPLDPGHYIGSTFDASFCLPYPTQGWDSLKNELVKIKATHGLDMIIPSLDAELPLYVKYQDELQKMGIATFLPSVEQFDLRSKDQLDKLCQSLGCTYPETEIIQSYESVTLDLVQKMGLPLVVKGKYYEAYFSYSLGEILRNMHKISSSWGLPVLLQKPVHGEEINLIGVGDGQGNALGLLAIKKLKTTNLGKMWSAVTIYNEPLFQLGNAFTKATSWRGPFELECIQKLKSKSNDLSDISLIEINPRFPSWVNFASLVGLNLPSRMLDFIENRAYKTDSIYESGKLLMRHTCEIVADMSQYYKLSSKDW